VGVTFPSLHLGLKMPVTFKQYSLTLSAGGLLQLFSEYNADAECQAALVKRHNHVHTETHAGGPELVPQ